MGLTIARTVMLTGLLSEGCGGNAVAVPCDHHPAVGDACPDAGEFCFECGAPPCPGLECVDGAWSAVESFPPPGSSTTAPTTTSASSTSTSTGTSTGECTSTGTAGTTTGGGGGIEAACAALCELRLVCEPDVYPDIATCAAACIEQAPGLPACETEAAAFNTCLSGLSCDAWLLALNTMEYGPCKAAFDTYGQCL